jgi:hypothetical protein
MMTITTRPSSLSMRSMSSQVITHQLPTTVAVAAAASSSSSSLRVPSDGKTLADFIASSSTKTEKHQHKHSHATTIGHNHHRVSDSSNSCSPSPLPLPLPLPVVGVDGPPSSLPIGAGRRFFIETYGCQVANSEHESKSISYLYDHDMSCHDCDDT